MCVKQHDVCPRRKRDVPLRGHVVELVLHKRRFWCIGCHKAFTERDSACGRRRRTTVQLREEIGQQASSRPITHVASQYQVGPRFVQACLEVVAFFDFLPTRLSNGFVEGKNNRTKAMMRQGYGYRNRRHLRLRSLLEVAA